MKTIFFKLFKLVFVFLPLILATLVIAKYQNKYENEFIQTLENAEINECYPFYQTTYYCSTKFSDNHIFKSMSIQVSDFGRVNYFLTPKTYPIGEMIAYYGFPKIKKYKTICAFVFNSNYFLISAIMNYKSNRCDYNRTPKYVVFYMR